MDGLLVVSCLLRWVFVNVEFPEKFVAALPFESTFEKADTFDSSFQCSQSSTSTSPSSIHWMLSVDWINNKKTPRALQILKGANELQNLWGRTESNTKQESKSIFGCNSQGKSNYPRFTNHVVCALFQLCWPYTSQFIKWAIERWEGVVLVIVGNKRNDKFCLIPRETLGVKNVGPLMRKVNPPQLSVIISLARI